MVFLKLKELVMLPRVTRETKGQKVICTFQIDLFIAFFALLVNLFICFG